MKNSRKLKLRILIRHKSFIRPVDYPKVFYIKFQRLMKCMKHRRLFNSMDYTK